MKFKISLTMVFILIILITPFHRELLSGKPYPDNVEVNLARKTVETIIPESEEFGRSSGNNTLIVTSGRKEFSEPFTTKLAVWLRAAFSARVDVVSQEELIGYKLPYYLKDKEVIVYYGTDYGRAPGEGFIKHSFTRIKSGETKLVWIGYHGDKIRGQLNSYGIGYGGVKTNTTPGTVASYVDTEANFSFRNRDFVYLELLNPELARVRARLENRPVVVSGRDSSNGSSTDSFYYVGFHPTSYIVSGGAHLIFMDLMHEVYGVRRNKSALIRLEDVNPTSDADKLAEIAGYLSEMNVPFTVSLIPFHLHENRLTTLREKDDLVKVLTAATKRGGDIVLHGLTHQHTGETGVDSEFWSEKTGTPLEEEGYVKSRIEIGLGELKASGLLGNNSGWETPHYKAGRLGYDLFEAKFDLIYEAPHWNYDLGFLPYPVIRRNSVYVPTNLGYYRGDLSGQQIEEKLTKAGLLQELQFGGVASFFYHPNLGLEKLRPLIAGLIEQGWKFASAKSVVKEFTAAKISSTGGNHELQKVSRLR